MYIILKNEMLKNVILTVLLQISVYSFVLPYLFILVNSSLKYSECIRFFVVKRLIYKRFQFAGKHIY